MLNISGWQYRQDPLLRQLSQHSSDNFDLQPPAGRTDPLLRQFNKNDNIKVQNLQPPPQRLTNIFEAMGAKSVTFPNLNNNLHSSDNNFFVSLQLFILKKGQCVERTN